MKNISAIAFFLVSAPLLLFYLVYSQSLGFNYVWDDFLLLAGLQPHMHTDLFELAFTTPFFTNENYYRPIVFYSLINDMAHYQADAFVPRLTNLLIAILNIVLLMAVLYQTLSLTGKRKWLVISFAGLAYGLHPALVEGIAWVSGRFDLLMTTFLLAILLVDGLAISRAFKFLLTVILFMAAALSKEMAVAFCLMLPMWHFLIGQEEGFTIKALWNKRDSYFALVLAGCIYLSLRYWGLGYIFNVDSDSLHSVSEISLHLSMVLQAVGQYTALALFPFNQVALFYEVNTDSIWLDPMALLGCGVILSVLWGGIRGASTWVGLVGIFLLSLIPVLHLLPLSISGSLIHSRFMTFPLAMLVLGVCVVVSNQNSWHRSVERAAVVMGSSILWLAANTFITASLVPVWKDDYKLWRWAASESSMPMPQIVFAQMLLNQGKPNESIEALLKVGPLKDELEVTRLHTLGTASKTLGRISEAERYFLDLLALNRGNMYRLSSHIALGEIYLAVGESGAAEKHLLRVLEEEPNHLVALSHLCNKHLAAHEYSEAGVICRKLGDSVSDPAVKRNIQEALLQYGLD